jgi:hypothetical protein
VGKQGRAIFGALLAVAMLAGCRPDAGSIFVTFERSVGQGEVASVLTRLGFDEDRPFNFGTEKMADGKSEREAILRKFEHANIRTITCTFVVAPVNEEWTLTCSHAELRQDRFVDASGLPPENQAVTRSLLAQLQNEYRNRIVRIDDQSRRIRR